MEERPRQTVNKIRYKYHYQDSENRLIFRYDNVPHHPSEKRNTAKVTRAACQMAIEAIVPSSLEAVSETA